MVSQKRGFWTHRQLLQALIIVDNVVFSSYRRVQTIRYLCVPSPGYKPNDSSIRCFDQSKMEIYRLRWLSANKWLCAFQNWSLYVIKHNWKGQKTVKNFEKLEKWEKVEKSWRIEKLRESSEMVKTVQNGEIVENCKISLFTSKIPLVNPLCLPTGVQFLTHNFWNMSHLNANIKIYVSAFQNTSVLFIGSPFCVPAFAGAIMNAILMQYSWIT